MSTTKGKASNKEYQKFEDEEQKIPEKKINNPPPGIFYYYFYSFLSFWLKIYFLKKKRGEKSR